MIALLHINPQLISYFKSVTLALGNIPRLAFKSIFAAWTGFMFMHKLKISGRSINMMLLPAVTKN